MMEAGTRARVVRNVAYSVEGADKGRKPKTPKTLEKNRD